MDKFIEQFYNSYYCEEQGEGFILRTPVMYQGADHSFSFYIEPTATGSFKISDRGQTLDYMRENFSPSRYEEKINAVCERFEITREGGEFCALLASFESGQTMRTLEIFIGAMNIIANIDID